jgi:hypothetical protein
MTKDHRPMPVGKEPDEPGTDAAIDGLIQSGAMVVPIDREDAGDVDDPFHPDKLRITDTSDPGLGLVPAILTVRVKKPGPQQFFRVHPDWAIDVRIIELQAEQEIYLVTPPVASQIPGETKPVRIVPYIARPSNAVSLWPLRLPPEDGRDVDWNISARRIAEQAKTCWVRMQSDRAGSMYTALTSDHIPPPVWPQTTFRDLLKTAFSDGRLIDRIDHPVIRQLKGR